MARVVCRDTDPGKASAAAHEVAAALRQAIASLPAGAVTLQGPMPCAIARIDDHHRLAVLLIGRDRGAIQSVLGRVRTLGLLKSDGKTAVDVDPVALL
jgi:primosomal protein N'